MPEIKYDNTVYIKYSFDDIVKLIIADLVEQHGISANSETITTVITGGVMYDDSRYWGGPSIGNDWKCDPVKFHGFSVEGKKI